MLIAITGPLGSYKTTVLTYLALKKFAAGFSVYANYDLKFPYGPGRVIPFDVKDLIGGNWTGPGFLALDELHVLLDSRSSQSDVNKLGTQMVLQTRKRSTDIGFTTQSLDQVDLRVRRLVDVIISCRKVKDIAHLVIVRTYDGEYKTKRLYCKPIFQLFDTNQRITMEQSKPVEQPKPVEQVFSKPSTNGNPQVPLS